MSDARARGRLGAFADDRPALFCILFVAATLAIHTIYLLGYFEGEIDYEERDYGSFAKDVLEGLVGPIGLYQWIEREGGAYFFYVWVVPFFAAMGPSLFALKLAALSFLAIGGAPWIDVARRLGGSRAAFAFALLVLLPFPHYLRMALNAPVVATHFGTIAFSGACVWAMVRGRAAGLFGLALGLGCFWAASFWPLAIGLAAVLLWRRPGRPARKRAIAAALPGIAATIVICLLPLIRRHPGGLWAAIADWTWPQMIVQGGPAGAAPVEVVTVPGIFLQLWRLLTHHLPGFAGLHYALLAAALAVVAARARQNLAMIAPPVLCFIAAYLVSGVYMEEPAFDQYRYLLPLLPFGLLVISLAAAHTPKVIAAGIIVSLGVWSVSSVFDRRTFPTPYRSAKGYNTFYLLGRAGPVIRALHAPGRSDYQAMAFHLGLNRAMDAASYEALHTFEVAALDRLLWPDYWEGFGTGCWVKMVRGDEPAMRSIRRALEGAPSEHLSALVRGLTFGRSVVSVEDISEGRPLAVEAVDEVVRHAERADPAAYYNGLGRGRNTDLLGKLRGDPSIELRFAEGLAAAFAQDLLPDVAWPGDKPVPRTVRAGPEIAPERFLEWTQREQARIRAINAAFVHRAPLDGDPGPVPDIPQSVNWIF